MEVIAKSRSVRISPRKVSLIADTIRGLSVNNALNLLLTTQKRASKTLEKTLKSAMANAKNKGLSENLIISQILVSQGSALKRFRPSTRGRVHPYKKRGSHIKITLKEAENGTKS